MPIENTRQQQNEEIQSILGHPPGWLLYWGITFIAMGMAIFIFLAWFIRYPDIIKAPIMITTKNPPTPVTGKRNAPIKKLMVINNQLVQPNDIIASQENAANWNDVKILEEWLRKIPEMNFSQLYYTQLIAIDSIGPLKSSFARLTQQIRNLKYSNNHNITANKNQAVKLQIEQTKKLHRSLDKQKEALLNEIEIAKQVYERISNLVESGNKSISAKETAETNVLQYERQLEALENQIINNEIKTGQLEIQILEQSQNNNNNTQLQTINIITTAQTLQTEIDSWKEQNLIFAPISGRVSIDNIITNNQFVTANKPFLYIISEKESSYFCKATLAHYGTGKVRIGMVVNIELNGYPFQEFGMIKGKVKEIGHIPGENGYFTEIEIPNHLVTTYGTSIDFRHEMGGTANIITENRRILERVFDKVLNVIYNI